MPQDAKDIQFAELKDMIAQLNTTIAALTGTIQVECYIKSEVNSNYYWVDDDGVYMSQYDTTTPDHKYRIVENYKTENAYQR